MNNRAISLPDLASEKILGLQKELDAPCCLCNHAVIICRLPSLLCQLCPPKPTTKEAEHDIVAFGRVCWRIASRRSTACFRLMCHSSVSAVSCIWTWVAVHKSSGAMSASTNTWIGRPAMNRKVWQPGALRLPHKLLLARARPLRLSKRRVAYASSAWFIRVFPVRPSMLPFLFHERKCQTCLRPIRTVLIECCHSTTGHGVACNMLR